VEISAKIVHGHAEDQILHESEKGGYDVIVMKHHTRGGLGKGSSALLRIALWIMPIAPLL